MLDEWRKIHKEQDEAYVLSLQIDQAKDKQKREKILLESVCNSNDSIASFLFIV